MSEDFNEIDPFSQVGDDFTEKFYKVDCAVFAEPLKILTGSQTPEETTVSEIPNFESQETVLRLDNITVTKRKGKRKKYSINLNDSELKCPQQHCQKLFTTPTLLKAHIRKVHCASKDYVCERCGAGFSAQYLLNRHQAVHGQEGVACVVCGKVLRKRTSMSQHLRSHADTRPHQCASCHKRFLRKSTLNVHVRRVHDKIGRKEDT